jgi:hypothetical protein
MAENNILIDYTRWLFTSFLKLTVVVVGLCTLIGAGLWGYDTYNDWPVKQTSYFDLNLGSSMEEVKYTKGVPNLVYIKDSVSGELITKPLSNFATPDKSFQDYKRWSYEPDYGDGYPITLAVNHALILWLYTVNIAFRFYALTQIAHNAVSMA